LRSSPAFNLAGSLTAPLLNSAAIKADYRSANARQVQAVIEYERAILSAYTEVYNQLMAISNSELRYEQIFEQVSTLETAIEISKALYQSTLETAIEISKALYQSAQADYYEVLMTTRDWLEAEIELVEARKDQMQANVAVYQALGGGWRTGA